MGLNFPVLLPVVFCSSGGFRHAGAMVAPGSLLFQLLAAATPLLPP